MSQFVISDLDEVSIQRLQRRAEAHGWAVEDEIRHILTNGLDALELAEKSLHDFHARTKNVTQATDNVLPEGVKLKQRLLEASNRDAQMLKELDAELEDMQNQLKPTSPPQSGG
jgi:plasmid stability protein